MNRIEIVKSLLAAEESEKLLGEIYGEFARQSDDPVWKAMWQRFAEDEAAHARQINAASMSFSEPLKVDPQHLMMVLDSMRQVAKHVKSHHFTILEKLRVAIKHEEKLQDFRIVEAAARVPGAAIGKIVPPSEHLYILRHKLQDEQGKAMRKMMDSHREG